MTVALSKLGGRQLQLRWCNRKEGAAQTTPPRQHHAKGEGGNALRHRRGWVQDDNPLMLKGQVHEKKRRFQTQGIFLYRLNTLDSMSLDSPILFRCILDLDIRNDNCGTMGP